MKIACFGARLANNLGGPSLLVASKQALEAFLPNPEFTLIVRAKEYAEDSLLAHQYGVRLAAFPLSIWLLPAVVLRRCTGFRIGPESVQNLIRVLEEADAVIDIWGILFADSLGLNMAIVRLTDGFHFLAAKLLGKPVVKYTADIGPFKKFWNRFFARFYLQHALDLILARDERTASDIRKLGVRTPIVVTADTAFLLETESGEISMRLAERRKGQPIIGLSVSYQIRKREKTPGSYIAMMSRLVAYMQKNINAYVVILPNEISSGVNDDRSIAKEIRIQSGIKDCEVIAAEGLRAQQLKGIIQQCDLIVAARYHTVVAALSHGIPTLVIGWHHKYTGVLGLFEQEEWLCSIKDLKESELLEKFDALWAGREAQAEKIRRRIEPVKQNVRDAAEQVSRFLQEQVSAVRGSLN
ncbi:polysaccharide pyruvyl transferase family protein [candidate division KSB1 bacterium]|nr:polysaccharide pyruvyl transferase family protein [candidate division KSB1 bacterium]